jgi:Ca2+-transporting ATPase
VRSEERIVTAGDAAPSRARALARSERQRRRPARPIPSAVSPAEARHRLARAGPNRVADTGETPLWRLVLRQFKSLVVLLLLAAAGIAWGLGEHAEAIAILAALLLNAAIGCATEWRAQVSLAKLRALVIPTSRVRRDGKDLHVPAATLVPGDVILLEAGSQIPADARLPPSHGHPRR